jgi:putative membrane protein insertion efficiency factor
MDSLMARQSRKFKTKMALIIIVSVIMTSMGFTVSCYCMDETPFAPWDYNNPGSDREATPAQETDASFCGYYLMQAIRFYQHYISPVIGDRCQMYPSCSSYAVEAIKKHGCLIGSVMTSDRLIHEANEMDHAPVIEKEGEFRYYDPVGGNDFWWYKGSDSTTSQPDSR